MNTTETIKIIKELEVTDLSGEKVMIDFETGKYFMIKGAGNDIWDIMKDGMKVQTIIDQLLDIYEVDEATCTESAIKFLQQMEHNGFIKMEA